MATTPTTTPKQGFDEAQRRARVRMEKQGMKRKTPAASQPNPLKLAVDEFKRKTYNQ